MLCRIRSTESAGLMTHRRQGVDIQQAHTTVHVCMQKLAMIGDERPRLHQVPDPYTAHPPRQSEGVCHVGVLSIYLPACL